MLEKLLAMFMFRKIKFLLENKSTSLFIIFIFMESFVFSNKTPFGSKLREISLSIQKNESLKTVASGGSCPDGVIKKFDLTLESNYNSNIEDSRRQIIRIVEQSLELINSDKTIHSHLKHYPFGFKDLSFIIFYKTPFNDIPEAPNIYISYFNDGKLKYQVSVPPKKQKSSFHLAETVLQETYEEAIEKIKNEEKSD